MANILSESELQLLQALVQLTKINIKLEPSSRARDLMGSLVETIEDLLATVQAKNTQLAWAQGMVQEQALIIAGIEGVSLN